MRERGQSGNAASSIGRELFEWGFFNRRNGEFSSGVDRTTRRRRNGRSFRISRWAENRRGECNEVVRDTDPIGATSMVLAFKFIKSP
jgi:hypothetical protein